MTKLGIRRAENETDGEFICRLMVYTTELENEVLMWRNVAKEISKMERNLKSITKILKDAGMINDGKTREEKNDRI